MSNVSGPTGSGRTPDKRPLEQESSGEGSGILFGKTGSKKISTKTGSSTKGTEAAKAPNAGRSVIERIVTELTLKEKNNAVSKAVGTALEKTRSGTYDIKFSQVELGRIEQHAKQLSKLNEKIVEAQNLVGKRRLEASEEGRALGLDKAASINRWETEIRKEPAIAKTLKTLDCYNTTKSYLDGLLYSRISWQKMLVKHNGNTDAARNEWRNALEEDTLLAHSQEEISNFFSKYNNDKEFRQAADELLKKDSDQSWFSWGKELLGDIMGTLTLMNDMEYHDMVSEISTLEEKDKELELLRSTIAKDSTISEEQKSDQLQQIKQERAQLWEAHEKLQIAAEELNEEDFRSQHEIVETVCKGGARVAEMGMKLGERTAQAVQTQTASIKQQAQQASSMLATANQWRKFGYQLMESLGVNNAIVDNYLSVPFMAISTRRITNKTGEAEQIEIQKAVRHTKAGMIAGIVVPVVIASAVAIGVGLATGGIALPIALIVIGIMFGGVFGPMIGGYVGFQSFRYGQEEHSLSQATA